MPVCAGESRAKAWARRESCFPGRRKQHKQKDAEAENQDMFQGNSK